VFVLPYIYLCTAEPYRRLDPRWSQLARTLGASQGRTFLSVRLPLLLAPCLVGLAIGFSVSVGQYLVTQLLGAGRVTTLTTEAVALAAGGNNRIVGVWALAQTLMPALVFAFALAIPRLIWRNRRAMLGPQ
jgi:putative thiamine transport system permease protein